MQGEERDPARRAAHVQLAAAACEELRIARRLDDLSVAELARRARMSRSVASEILRGAQGVHTASLDRLAAALGGRFEVRFVPNRKRRRRTV